MLGLTGLSFLFLAFGAIFLVAKLLFKLLVLPITLGLWVGKAILGVVFTLLGGIALLALLPVAILALPVVLIAAVLGLLALPFVLLVKLFV